MADLSDVAHISSGPAFEKLGLVHRIHSPSGNGPHPTLVMLHGLQGTEDVTWVFARAVGPEWLIISPRAPLPAKEGYTWNGLDDEGKTDQSSFKVGLDALNRFIGGLPEVYPANRNRLVLLGFSQGAAMAYTYGTVNPVLGIAALAGFIPPHIAEHLPPLYQLPILMLHGTKDETVSITTARQNRDQLKAAGAALTYQESEVGHKVSSGGIGELKRWLAERLQST